MPHLWEVFLHLPQLELISFPLSALCFPISELQYKGKKILFPRTSLSEDAWWATKRQDKGEFKSHKVPPKHKVREAKRQARLQRLPHVSRKTVHPHPNQQLHELRSLPLNR